MATVDTLRNNLIDKLLTITNKEYLLALNELVGRSKVTNDKVSLSNEQIIMLQMSDQDIAAGNVIPQEQADKEDLAWLKGL